MAEYCEYEWKTSRLAIHDNGPNPFQPNKPDPNTAIHALRDIIRRSDDPIFRNADQDDKTLLKFLNARKFVLEESYQLFLNYLWYRQNNSAIFKNFHIDAIDIIDSLKNCLPGVLQSKDRKGRCVLILNANNWECNYGLISIYRALLFTLEYLLNDPHNQTNGFVIIVDWTEFTFKKTMNLKPAVLKLMIEGLQDSFPARFKGIHFLGQPWYVEAALTVIKPFLNEKVKDRIFVHGNNLSTLHEFVHKDILPAEMGGEQPSYNPGTWIKIIESKSIIP